MANNFNPYNNGYNNNFYMQEFQNMKDRIDRTMQQYQQNQYVPQQQVQPQIQQTFQLAPNQNNSNSMDALIVNNEEEVRNQLVVKPTIFTTQDYSNMWIKDVTGNVRYFRTEEIIQVDENIQEINKKGTKAL